MPDTHARWWEESFAGEAGTAYRARPSRPTTSLGRRPCLLVVDVVRAFTGEKGRSLDESLAEWPTSCGPAAWETVPRIRRLVEAASAARVPVAFTCAHVGGARLFGGPVKDKDVDGEDPVLDRPGAQDFPKELQPPAGALVLPKTKASAFFATPLLAYLTRRDVDTVVVAGGTTSGCVRATVVDGHSWGFRMVVPADACFDRSHLSHGVSLYEMDAKYADVVFVDDVVRALGSSAGS